MKIKHYKLVVIALVIFSVLMASACGNSSQTTQSSQSESPATASESGTRS